MVPRTLVQAWLGREQIIANLDDSAGRAIFNDVNNIIRFFQDDLASVTENSGGSMTMVKIFGQGPFDHPDARARY